MCAAWRRLPTWDCKFIVSFCAKNFCPHCTIHFRVSSRFEFWVEIRVMMKNHTAWIWLWMTKVQALLPAMVSCLKKYIKREKRKKILWAVLEGRTNKLSLTNRVLTNLVKLPKWHFLTYAWNFFGPNDFIWSV